MADALIAKQTSTAVDKVAGATHSWAEFRHLVNEALENGPVPTVK